MQTILTSGKLSDGQYTFSVSVFGGLEENNLSNVFTTRSIKSGIFFSSLRNEKTIESSFIKWAYTVKMYNTRKSLLQ